MRWRPLPNLPELSWTPYAWLIYLGIFLAQPVLGKGSMGEWAATVAGLLAFLVLYFVGFWIRDARILWIVGAIALLGVLFAPFNAGASVFFVYAASFPGYSLRPAAAARVIGLLVLLVIAVAWAFEPTPFFWIPAIVFTVLVGGINIHYSTVSRANARLRESQEEAQRLARTAERERIARDLHDVLGHTLSVIALKSELAAKLIPRDPERAAQEIRDVERISREALREVRGAIAGYRSEGLAAELARARLALESSGIKIDYFVVPVEPRAGGGDRPRPGSARSGDQRRPPRPGADLPHLRGAGGRWRCRRGWRAPGGAR